MKNYILGKRDNEWHPDESTQITFVVTKDCNLQCKYCYMVGKNKNERMTFDVAKQTIDYFLENKKTFFNKEYIVLDFIGGEPLLEIDLIDDIVDYFKYITFISNDEWFGKYRINIATNGLLYSNDKVQKFIKKNEKNLSIGISIDGIKEKHDLQRVYPNGVGSYDDVVKNVHLWIKQYPEASTKVTIGHEDIKYVKDSIIHLWNLGIKNVPANTVFENVWEEGDDILFEEQLRELADYIIDNKLWNVVNTTLFSEHLGFKMVEDEWNKNFCGTGKAYTVDWQGKVYPCVRFMKYSLRNKEEIVLGDIYNGIDRDKLRPFKILTAKMQSPQKCLECPVSTECAYCQAENYDSSLMNTNYERSLASCKMHKARVRANNYFWAKLYNLYDVDRLVRKEYKNHFEKSLYILMEDDCVPICANYSSSSVGNRKLSVDGLKKALKICNDEFFQPYFVHSKNIKGDDYIVSSDSNLLTNEFIIKHIVYYSRNNIDLLCKKYKKQDIYPVFTKYNINNASYDNIDSCILLVYGNELDNISKFVQILKDKYKRINLKCEVTNEGELEEYAKELYKLADIVADEYYLNRDIEVSVLTDRLFINDMVDNCYAGEKNLSFAPDEKMYICPSQYYSGGKLDKKEMIMTKIANSPLCSFCDYYQCERCVFMNKSRTLEYNIPSSIQCYKSSIEVRATLKLKQLLENKYEKLKFKEIKEHGDKEIFDYMLRKWQLIE